MALPWDSAQFILAAKHLSRLESIMSKFAKCSGLVVGALVMVASQVTAGQQSTCEGTSSASRDTVAELREVQGNVLVSDKAGMASAISGQRVPNGVRITTTSKASVTVAFDCGCNVQLKENERIDAELPRSCAGLLAAVTGAAPATALGASAVTATAGSFTAPIIAGAVGVGGYLLYRNGRNSSPN